MEKLTRIKEISQLLEFVQIELTRDFLIETTNQLFLLDEEIDNFIHVRERQSHKGTYGHALILAGEYGKMGAAILSGKACLRSGVGLLTLNIPKCGYAIAQTSVPEALCITDSHSNILTELPPIEKYDAIGMGPGIGRNDLTAELLQKILLTAHQPLVLDADAITILAERNEVIELLPVNTILTPHIKEFERLIGPVNSVEERFKKLQEFSIQHKCIVVLKDAYTCVSSSTGDLYFNTSGNQGMATGGSGDVLTGIITGLLAQGYQPLLAALLGVFKHGVAGDLAARKKGYNALIASDIIECLRIDQDFC